MILKFLLIISKIKKAKNMNRQFPDYDNYIKAVILSANDVIATILLLDEDEGYAPLNIAQISLPNSARAYRANNPDGKAMFQRGDLITIKCEITKREPQSEKLIEAMADLIMDESEEGDNRLNILDTEKQTAKYWADLEKRDLAKRVVHFQSQENQKEKTQP